MVKGGMALFIYFSVGAILAKRGCGSAVKAKTNHSGKSSIAM